MRTSSLVFACVDCDEIPEIGASGLAAGSEVAEVFEDVKERCEDCVLVIDRIAAAVVDHSEGRNHAPRIDADAIRNIHPYVEARPVTAAGGFIVRRRGERLQLLLIYRRGVWDLPKGKLDDGETIAECARREVREELGIDSVDIGRPLGQTVHGYRERDAYAVKTTHWFTMRTEATSFEPQQKEGIEKVEWVDIPEARERLGFETLRRHLDAVRILLSEM